MIELLLAAEGLLAAGRLDQAERLFEQVAEADPRNAIAVVGLARVALERGDRPGALAAAQRALEIDPQEAAARRLVAQLDETGTTTSAALVPELEPISKAWPEIEPQPATQPRRSWLSRLLAFLRRR